MAEVFLHINADNIEKIQAQLDNIEKTISRIEKSGKTGFNFSGASRGMSSVEASAVRVERAFRNAGEAVSSLGRGIQSVGNAFGGKVVGTVKTMATAFGTMGLFSAAQGTVKRYDTMRMFPKQMALLGFNADESAKAVDKLEQAVLGLPTGLDEIVESASQFVTFTNDMKKGTDIAIAANNALLSGSGSDSSARTWGQRQIRDLLSAGKLRTQEWESLIKAMGAANIRDIGKELGRNDYGKFRSDLKQNKIAVDDFIGALVKLGTEGGVIEQRANIWKDTLSAVGQNISNALRKLGETGIKSLDDLLTKKTGTSLLDTIRSISDGIKGALIPSLEEWVRKNGDSIVNFFERLKNYDWAGLVSKAGKHLAKYYDILTRFFSIFSPKVIAAVAVWGSPVGKAIQFIGGAIGGIGKVAATAIRLFGRGKAIDAATEGATKFSKFTLSLKGAFKGLALSTGIIGQVALIGGVIYEYSRIIQYISNMNISPDFARKMELVSKFAGGGFGLSSILTTVFSLLSSNPITQGAVISGELLSGGFTALVGAIGLVIRQYAGLVQYISDLNIDRGRLRTNVFAISQSSVIFAGLTKVVGFITAFKPLSSITGFLAIGAMNRAIKGIAEAFSALEQTQVPNSGKINDIFDAVQDISKNVRKNGGIDKWFEAWTGSHVIKNLSKATKNVGDVVKAIIDIQSSLATLTSDGRFGVENGHLDFYKIYDILDEMSVDMAVLMSKIDAYIGRFKSWNVSEKAQNIADTVSSFQSMMDAVLGIQTAAQSMNEQGRYGVGDKGLKFYEITDFIDEVGTNLYVSIIKMDALMPRLTSWNSKGKARNVEQVVNSFQNIILAVQGIQNLAGEMGKDGQFGAKSGQFDMFTVKTFIEGVVKNMIEIMDVIGEELGRFESWNKEKKAQNVQEAVDSIAAIVMSVSRIQTALTNMSVEGNVGFDSRRGKLSGRKLKTAISGIIKPLAELVSGDAIKQIAAGKVTSLENLKNAVTQFAGITSQLKTIEGQINGLGFDDNNTWIVGSRLESVMSSLSAAFGENGGTATNLLAQGGSLSTAAENLKLIAEQLGILAANAESASGGLEGSSSGLGALGKAASTHKSSIEKAAEALGKLKNAVSGIAGKAALSAGGVTLLGVSAKNQVDNITRAATAASSLASAINNIPTNKTVNVQTNTGGGGLWNTVKSIFTGHKATGGMIHGPGGIDNVPTWLTAGEFVMRKAAVNRFGAGFMNRINNMDIDGAIRALSIRAGAGVFSKGGVVTNNYSRDNHANVTFNIGRASQGYSQRRANRWARALS